MSDFENLISELLAVRPELTKSELTRRIEEKKKLVGAGYLTDQGALFLVAGELGVNLQRSVSSDLSLKDLHVGANDVTVVARVLATYPASTFQRKDGSVGSYKRITLFDKKCIVKLTAWDEKADEAGKMEIGLDSPVRVLNGYVKQGLDGKPTLNLGKRGKLELLKDDKILQKLDALEVVAEELTKPTSDRLFHAVNCTVASEPRYSEFVRSDGSPGSLFQFEATDKSGGDACRVVIWSPSDRPELRVGERVRITALRARRTSRGDFELHGDSGSVILRSERSASAAAVGLRVAAVFDGQEGTTVLAVDREKRVKAIEAGKDRQVRRGDAILVSPDSMSDGRMVCRTDGSLTAAKEDSVPALGELGVKVKDARDESTKVMVEVIALSRSSVGEVRLRDGTVVKKGELVVGDDSGEIQVVGWRDQSEKMVGIEPGERLRIIGVSPKTTKMGALILQVLETTVVDRLKAGA